MKASLCFLILALSQSIYCTPTVGLGIGALTSAAGGSGGSGGSDCDSDKGGAGGAGDSGDNDNNGGGHPNGNGSGPGAPGGAGLPSAPGGAGLPSAPGGTGLPSGPGGAGLPSVPGVGSGGLPSAPGGSFACAQCEDDDTDCSPITGLDFAKPAKVAPGGVGKIALAAPQLAIINKAKSELVHGAEAVLEAASHADADKSFQLLLNVIDKVVVRAGQLIDTFVPGAGAAVVQIYAKVSKAAHVVAKIETCVKVGLTGGENGLLGGGLL